MLLTLLLVALAGCSDDDSDRIATDGGDFDLSTDFGPLDGSLDLGADLSTCPDVDGDGVPAAACGGTDCDDGDPTRYPGAEEVCDGDDEDCNSATLGPDADGDGETYLGCCNGSEGCGTDCDDTRRSVSAAASETCNGEDDDCDGRVDEDVLTTACFDADGDGRGAVSPTVVGCAVPVGAVTTCNDCDDGDPSRYLGAPESCNDVDDDCDGAVDESCACSEGATRPCGSTGGACVVGTQVCLGGAWESECVGAVTPEAEACDGLDNDCDGLTDEGLQTIFYADCDLDGSGASASAVATCVRPASAPDGCARGAWTILGGDCDDSDPLRSARVGCGGAMDAGAPDLGMDAGTTDLGVDAGMEDLGVDAGTTDAGTDGGVVDAGVDAGPRDLGVDASAMDLGIDSGATDLGVDAGTAMDASTMPVFGAAVATQSIPRLLTAGRPATFTITMTNTGTTGWMGSTFQLASGNVPTTLWGLTESALGSAEFVAAGATRTFTLSVTAPTTPGTYSSDWIMEQVPGIGRFGEVARTTDIVVTLCGNGVLDDAEICDDANLLDGDGCSSICVPSVSYDLLTDADRTLVGSRSLRALAAVTIGDFTNDGVPEIVVGESADFMPAGGTNRSQAGTVYAYAGGAGFFGGTSTVPAGATLVVGGASASDGLGATSTSGLVVADVTGDGVRDLLLSAQGGDGIGEARLNAGEVYVLRGGAGLASAGTIDLGASPASPLLVATIVGANAGDGLILLDAGADLTGDGVNDIVIGAPGSDIGGVDAGAAYIVTGGSALSGVIDLAAPGAITVRTITGAEAGEGFGRVAASGDLDGVSTPDLLLGSANHSTASGTSAGAAFAFFGPITSDRTLASASAQWSGAGANDKLGTTVAIAHVLGSSAPDVVLGATQQRSAGVQTGAVNVWRGPLLRVLTPLLPDAADVVILGVDNGDTTGSALTVGDVNGDRFADLAFAAGTADGPANARSNAGEAIVMLGGPSLPARYDLATRDPAVRVFGAATNDRLGTHVNNIALGDINADGLADLCIGSFRGGSGAVSSPGRVDCFASLTGCTSDVRCRTSAPCEPFVVSCGGGVATCRSTGPSPAGTVCRTATSVCDAEEICDGVRGTCPEDLLVPLGTRCTPDGNRECNDFGECVCPPFAPDPCGSVCVDFTSDNGYCGGCDIGCEADQRCVGGMCV